MLAPGGTNTQVDVRTFAEDADVTATRSVTRAAALSVVLSVLFLTFLDTTIVSVALGSIQDDLGAGVIPLQWVLNAYSLVFASLMLIAGSLGDRFGRKSATISTGRVRCWPRSPHRSAGSSADAR